MPRLHQPLTWLSLALTVVGVFLLFLAPGFPAASVLLAAQVAALAEFKKYTGRFQFIMILASAVLLGVAIDLPVGGKAAIVALLCASLAIVLRQAYMPQFTYVNKLWVEPVLLACAAALLSMSWINDAFTWTTHVYPLATFGGGCFLCGSYLQDGFMMRRRKPFGYRVQPGMPAPDFVLPDQEGRSVHLADHRGQYPVLLIFVRGDWCPGCHMMLRTYEKHADRFLAKGVHVIAIGPDSVEVNRDMVQRIGVSYQLLSDSTQQASQRYGVVYDNPAIEAVVNYAEGIPLPASFLVDTDGIVRYVSRPDRVGEFLDPTLIFNVLQQLPSRSGTPDGAQELAA